MKKDRALLNRQYLAVKDNLATLEMQMAEYRLADGEEAVFAKGKVVTDVRGGAIRGVMLFQIEDEGYVKFSELPKLIKFLTIVAGKNGIHLG